MFTSDSDASLCTICLSVMNPENRSVLLTCLHEFCFPCIGKWAEKNAVCPLCRQNSNEVLNNIRSDDDYDIYQITRPISNNAQGNASTQFSIPIVVPTYLATRLILPASSMTSFRNNPQTNASTVIPHPKDSTQQTFPTVPMTLPAPSMPRIPFASPLAITRRTHSNLYDDGKRNNEKLCSSIGDLEHTDKRNLDYILEATTRCWRYSEYGSNNISVGGYEVEEVTTLVLEVESSEDYTLVTEVRFRLQEAHCSKEYQN
ncbi:hypothetical protein HELRODRAFT_163440 [Helobdella robusta]|uniref:RING-type E3 ubiquitin transferase n=1 Tax=Helobdella robusta TaxID=6412 RepID=T1EU19_HELRO|nr:hypothetical protein HELRODRAFT_163440 [Helobdella robusta]ESN96382.1 hypothetical protein HELRODRAFT_163440 [Helobdella robusta]